MRTADQANHQMRIGKPISTRHSGRPTTLYTSPIQKVLIWNRKCDCVTGSASSTIAWAMMTPITAVTTVK